MLNNLVLNGALKNEYQLQLSPLNVCCVPGVVLGMSCTLPHLTYILTEFSDVPILWMRKQSLREVN